jgi:hypothetical protein
MHRLSSLDFKYISSFAEDLNSLFDPPYPATKLANCFRDVSRYVMRQLGTIRQAFRAKIVRVFDSIKVEPNSWLSKISVSSRKLLPFGICGLWCTLRGCRLSVSHIPTCSC